MNAIELVREKNRVYILNAPFEILPRLQAIGCHRDTDRGAGAWWIGAGKVSALTALVAKLQTPRGV